MADFTRNDLDQTSDVFDAFVQFQFGSDRYLFDGLQQMTVEYNFLDVDKYSYQGELKLVGAGQNHTWELRIPLTADMFDTANPPTDVKTLSYYIYQKTLKKRVLVTVRDVSVSESGANPTVDHSFVGEFQKMRKERPEGGGDIQLVLSGRVTTFTKMQRS